MSETEPSPSATPERPIDERLESRLVWIWGSPRSGSSWLLQQLCHPLEPDVSAAAGFRPLEVPESTPPADGYDAIPVDETFIPNHLAPAFGDPIEVDGGYVPATINNYLGRKPGYAFSHPFEDVWRPELRRLVLARLGALVERAVREELRVADDATVVIKEVNGSHASDLVMTLLPRSRMLFLVRDGRDVVDSLLAAYAPGGFLARNQGQVIDSPEGRELGLAWAARLWACNVDVTLKAHSQHAPQLRLIVRYEDLIDDPQTSIRTIFEWLGLPRSDAWLRSMVTERSFGAVPEHRRGAGRRQRAATPGLWRENLTADEQALVTEIMGPRLERLGYES